jgi:ethanolamine ammonia-lyase small subunit
MAKRKAEAGGKLAAPSGHPLAPLRRFTEARIGLGRFGAGLPTQAHLDFAEAHARARDAVHASFDEDAIEAELEGAGYGCLRVHSQAETRATYLRRPDLGRRLAAESVARLNAVGGGGDFDAVLIISEGLSAHAVNTYAAETAIVLLGLLGGDRRLAPVVLAAQGRVALSDGIGEALRAKLAIILIGERPGLSAADSLGAYLTFDPKTGRSDADRNCVSNIRKGGISPKAAAKKIAGLATRALSLGFSGTRLKDDQDELIEGEAPDALPG